MECKVKKVNEVCILHVIGRLDASNAKDLEDQIIELIDSGETAFVANLERLDYVSSSGLRVFLFIGKKLSAKGLIHFCCLQQQVNKVFEISGFSTIFEFFENQESAIFNLVE